MSPANLGAVRPSFLTAAVLAFLSVPLSAQVVEKGRTFADLTASHPCSSAYLDRIARVTDCDAADDIGDGEGAFQCWATCDGSAPWAAVSIGAGGGGLPGANEVTEAMLKAVDTANDEEVLTYETTTGDFEWQPAATGTIGGSTGATDDKLLCSDGAGGATLGVCTVGDLDNLRLDGNTLSSTNTNGDVVIAPNGSGEVTLNGASTQFGTSSFGLQISNPATHTIDFQRYDGSRGDVRFTFQDAGTKINLATTAVLGWGASGPSFANDTTISRGAVGVLNLTSTLHLNPLVSPPRACDATAEGDIYADTSHALCFCDGTSWNVLTGSGAGSCA